MIMKLAAAACAAFIAALALPAGEAHADGVQIEGGGVVATDTETFLLTGRAGYIINLDTGRRLFVAPEVEGAVGIFGSDDNFETDRTIGIFGRAGARLSSQWSVHGRVGWQSLRVLEETPAFDISRSNGAVAWGGGVTYHLDDNWGIRGDYTRSDGIGQVGLTVAYTF
jgi:opacity protein-like surface antigen